jgi:hypothetical protein
VGKLIFTPEVLASLPTMLQQGMEDADIAAAIGCNVSTLKVVCSRHKISLRRPEAWKLARREARRKLRTEMMIENLPPKDQAKRAEREKEFATRLVNAKIKVHIEPKLLALMTMRAEMKRTTVDVIAKQVLETIIEDNLWDAVIDEAA